MADFLARNEGNAVYISSSGKLLNKHIACADDGLLAAIRIEVANGRQWSVLSSCVHLNSGDFALSDDRGQIFHCSIEKNTYHIVRSASTIISAMDYVHCTRNQLAVSYDQGATVILDVNSREIIQNIQSESGGVVRIIRCHPVQPILAIVTDSKVVEMWNLRSASCMRTLDCVERILDVQFVLGGRVVMVTLEFTGAYLYRSSDWTLLSSCSLPASERLPKWTAAMAWEAQSSHKSKSGAKRAPIQTAVDPTLFVLLAADNGMLYLWGVEAIHAVADDHTKPTLTVLVGVIELPVKIRAAVGLTHLGDRDRSPRIGVLASDGGVLELDVTDVSMLQPGQWTVVAELCAACTQGVEKLEEELVPLLTPPEYYRAGTVPKRRDGMFSSNIDNLLCVGLDGALRLFDSEKAIGVGRLSGLQLRTRRPFTHDRASNVRPLSASGAYQQDSFGDNQHDSSLSTNSKSRKTQGTKKPSDRSSAPSPTTTSRANRNTSTYASTSRTSATTRRSATDSHATNKEKDSTEVRKKSVRASPPLRSPSTHAKSTLSPRLSPDDPVNLPLFKLAQLSAREQRVNTTKLVSFLEKHGEYPSRYRTLIWRFLLKLPENSEPFADLVRRGCHPAYEKLHRQYPVSDERLFQRLQQACSQLTHWSPIFGELSYIPQMVFPFVILFGSDELSILETVMTILMWWGYSWHATFPNPPLHITDAIDSLLKLHDEGLYAHLRRLGVAPGVMGWAMLSSLFTEILGREDWLKMMDYMFTYFEKSQLVILVPVAIIRGIRTSLLSAGNATHIVGYCRQQQGINIRDVIASINIMLDSTPAKYFAACPQQTLEKAKKEEILREKRGTRLAVDNDMDDHIAGLESMALHAGHAIFPLPTGRYPAYDGHPKFLVDWELKKRDKALSLQEEISRREDVLGTLHQKIQKMEDEHAQWMTRHQAATDSEILHRKSLMEAEKKHLHDLQRIEQEISRQRITSLQVLETTAAEEMELMDRLARDAQKLLVESESHMSQKMELTLNIQKHRELAEAAEAITHEKLNKIHMRRSRDEWVKSMATVMRGKEEEFESQNLLLQENWQKQDEEMRAKRSLRSDRSKTFVQNEELDRLHDEMTTRMQRLHIAREAKILEIERARAVRLAKEQAEEAIEANERSALALKKHELAAATESAAWLAESGVRQAQVRLQKSVELVQSESEKLLELERAHELRQHQAQQQARAALLRKEWADKQAQQLREVLEAESELQQQILTLQRASMKAEIGQGSVISGIPEELRAPVTHDSGAGRYTNLASSAMADARSDIERLGDEVLQQQRDRFVEMRQELSSQHQAQLREQQQTRRDRPTGAANSRHRGSAEGSPESESSSSRGAARTSEVSSHAEEDVLEYGGGEDPRWFASPDQPAPRQQRRTGTANNTADFRSVSERVSRSQMGSEASSTASSRGQAARGSIHRSGVETASPSSEQSTSSRDEFRSRHTFSGRAMTQASSALSDTDVPSPLAGKAQAGTGGWSGVSSPDSEGDSSDWQSARSGLRTSVKTTIVGSVDSLSKKPSGYGRTRGSGSSSSSQQHSSEDESRNRTRQSTHNHDLSYARERDFDDFVQAGGIGRHAGLRSPQPQPSRRAPTPPTGDSAPWAADMSN